MSAWARISTSATVRPDDVDAWKDRDPLIVDTKLVEALRPEIDREIDAAVAFAERRVPRPATPNS